MVPGFPELYRVEGKTFDRDGSLRRRWKDDRGHIFEWGSQHDRLERYGRNGRHIGEFDPVTGEQTVPADATRKIEP